MDFKQEFEAKLSDTERELFRQSDTAYYMGYSEFLEQRLEAGQHETIVIGTAADEWQTGEPKESGRYLVEYQQGERIKKVFVMDYDAFEGRWLTHSTEAEVLRWAKINSEYQ